MKRFDYLIPKTIPEALAMLSDRSEAIPLAGGTDILVQMKTGQRAVKALVSLKRLSELHSYSHNGTLTLGSAVTLGQICADQQIQQEYPALSISVSLIGSRQIRNMATIGGNVCNAAPSADTAPALLALDARAVIVGSQGERVIPLTAFFLEPGRTTLQAGELLKDILIPKPANRSGSFYVRHTPRARMDTAIAAAAAAVTVGADDVITDARLALGAVAPIPMRAVAAEALLVGQHLTDELLQKVGAAAAKDTQPIDDLRASAEYRRHLADVLSQRALRNAFARARNTKG